MWNELKETEKPLVLYGTGDAAEKILKELDTRNIPVSGIFASDGFVRDRSFAGFKVLSYGQAKEKFSDMTVLLCFGSHRPDVIENIRRIASEQDFYAPDLPVAGDGLFDREYYDAHKEALDRTRERLADGQSRLVFDKVIEYRLSGRIEPLLECSSPEEENWRFFVSAAARRKSGTDGLHFLDLGAYTGDTVELFVNSAGAVSSEGAPFAGTLSSEKRPSSGAFSITAVEPEERNFRKLRENAAALFGEDAELSGRIRLINAAAGSSCCTVDFTHGAGRGGAEGKGKVRPVKQLTVDSMLGEEGVDLVKMDLEGAEAEAILGAEETIRRCRPVMMIAAYHRTEDLFAIPGQVLDIVPDYRLYLRKDPCVPAWGVNYFFV